MSKTNRNVPIWDNDSEQEVRFDRARSKATGSTAPCTPRNCAECFPNGQKAKQLGLGLPGKERCPSWKPDCEDCPRAADCKGNQYVAQARVRLNPCTRCQNARCAFAIENGDYRYRDACFDRIDHYYRFGPADPTASCPQGRIMGCEYCDIRSMCANAD